MKSTSHNTSCDCGTRCSCKNCLCSPYAVFFDALGNDNRLYLLRVLGAGSKSVTQLCEATCLEQTSVSHALKQLEQTGLVTHTQKGKFRMYQVNKKTVGPLMKLIDSHVKKYCAPLAKPCCCGG